MELFLENIAKDAMDPSTYQYFKGLQDRRIVFNDEVDDRIVESVMLPLLRWTTTAVASQLRLY